MDEAGNLYISDYSQRIRKVWGGMVTIVVGGGSVLGDNGPAISAQLNHPLGVAVDSLGNLYLADFGNQRIREVSHGVIFTVAGNGREGYSFTRSKSL